MTTEPIPAVPAAVEPEPAVDPAQAPAHNEGDEFEDFPLDENLKEWVSEKKPQVAHLWTESWDDENEESITFSEQLKVEMAKLQSK